MPMSLTPQRLIRAKSNAGKAAGSESGGGEPTAGAVAVVAKATQVDVIAALKASSLDGAWPQDEADLLEFFNTMLQIVVSEGPSPRKSHLV